MKSWQRALLLPWAGSSAPSSLLTSLGAYWALEEASGTRVDATGRGNGLSPTNTPGNGTGKIGNALSVASASSQYVSAATNADLAMGNVDFTIAIWINFTTVTNLMCPIAKDASATNREYRIDFNANTIRFFTFTSGGSVAGQVTVALTPSGGTWYFLCAWQDVTGNTVNISLNNGATQSATRTGTPATVSADFALGKNSGGSAQYFNGLIDEVGLWKRVLTSAEITNLYNGGTGRTYPFTGT